MPIETEITHSGSHYEISNPSRMKMKQSKVQHLPLKRYLYHAKKVIARFANGYQYGLSGKMLRNEDAISAVAFAMMYADNKWEPGMGMSQTSWRLEQAKFAIKRYLNRSSTRNNMMHSSLDYFDEVESQGIIRRSPFNENYFNEIQERANLTDIETECLRLKFLEDRSIRKISDQLTLSHSKTLYIFKTALGKVKQAYKCNLISP